MIPDFGLPCVRGALEIDWKANETPSPHRKCNAGLKLPANCRMLALQNEFR
ncbi:hypothetical protein H4S14_004152 [Agrobacterium vitis]|nr:hypothetical protein [Agrobacterium vitis]MBE1440378.1 hypothetical protein [Agrobacterium vitis]